MESGFRQARRSYERKRITGAYVHVLSILGFMIVTFAAQGLSHFLVNKEHFSAISYLRESPIIPMGLLAMVTSGGTGGGGEAVIG